MLAPNSRDAVASRFGRILSLNYSGDEWRRDLLAGLTVAAISLPQAMAYALIAGVDPRFGLYSAIVVTAVAALFGSSSHLINGPTSAISLVVFSALATFDTNARVEIYEAMFLLGVMVGILQIFYCGFQTRRSDALYFRIGHSRLHDRSRASRGHWPDLQFPRR